MLAAAVVIAAAACSTDRQPTYRELDDLSRRSLEEQIRRPEPDTCRMAEFQSLMGADGDEIDPSTLPERARVVCHNCAVTMDYRSDRLNIELGPDGKVVRLRCG
jgi:hypothetical protein